MEISVEYKQFPNIIHQCLSFKSSSHTFATSDKRGSPSIISGIVNEANFVL